MAKELLVLKETLHMIKTHPIKSLGFFVGCSVIAGGCYYVKMRIDTDQAIRKTHDDTDEAARKTRNETDEAIRKTHDDTDEVVRREALLNAEKLKFMKESNRLRTPWIFTHRK